MMDRQSSHFDTVVLPTYTHVISKAGDEKGQDNMRKRAKCFLNITFYNEEKGAEKEHFGSILT